MSFFEIDFTYDVEEYGTVLLEADSQEEADLAGREYVRETYPDVKNILIEEIKEIIR